MKNIWLHIKENKVATIAIIAAILLMAVVAWLLINPPDKTKVYREYLEKENKTLHEEVYTLRMRDTVLMQSLQFIKDKLSENDGKIKETIYWRDKVIRTIDTLSTSGKQQFFTDRYGER